MRNLAPEIFRGSFGRPLERPGLTWSNVWQNLPIEQKLNIVLSSRVPAIAFLGINPPPPGGATPARASRLPINFSSPSLPNLVRLRGDFVLYIADSMNGIWLILVRWDFFLSYDLEIARYCLWQNNSARHEHIILLKCTGLWPWSLMFWSQNKIT